MMNRTEFIKMCGLFGISLPFQSVLNACENGNEMPIIKGNFNGSVLIVGAGAAGMATGYLLEQLGISYKILEADKVYGGRFRTNTTFADFPIPLGAEWLHVSREALPMIVNDPTVEITTETLEYSAEDTAGYYEAGELTIEKVGSTVKDDQDKKFIGSSWFHFFDEYIVPSIRENIQFNTPVEAIEYAEDVVVATSKNGQRFQADKVVVTVPLKILQLGKLAFNPPLPSTKQEAISKATIWSGIKIFIKFDKNFYPTFLYFPDSQTNKGQRLYYDAAYGQNSKNHILGLFAVGSQAEVYQNYQGTELQEYVLQELDEIFEGKASKHFQEILIQNWNEQPYAQGAYLEDEAPSSISRIMAKSVNNKLYFAGCSYTKINDWSSVHTAAHSARDVVRELIA